VLVVSKIVGEYESNLSHSGILAPPNNFTVTGVPAAILACWDTYPGEDLCWQVQYNTSAAEDGSETTALATRGSYYIYPVVDDEADSGAAETLYFRVRAVRWISDNNVMYSAWSAWTEGTSCPWLKEHDHSTAALGGTSLSGLTALIMNAPTELTIDTGAITVTQVYHRIDTESNAASDDLDTINGGSAGQLLVIRPENGSRTVVVKHNTGNIWMLGGDDLDLDDITDHLLFVYDATNSKWCCLGGAGGSGSGATAFTGLTDTPAAYTDEGGKLVRVNAGEDALEFTTDLPDHDHSGAAGDGGTFSVDNLSDVDTSGAANNKVLKWNGAAWVAGTAGDTNEFTFYISSFSDGVSTQEIGSGVWKAIGALSFTASYNCGPPTSATVNIISGHAAWVADLDMGGPDYEGATVSVEAVNYPAAPGSIVFRLSAATAGENDTDDETVTFYNRRHWGVTSADSGYDSDDIGDLANDELSGSRVKTFTVNPGAGEYILYAYPSRLGAATFTVGGFEGGFEDPETVSRTNDSGYTEDYYVYRSTNANLGSTEVVVT